MHYKQFEDLPIWNESRELVKMIYKNTKESPMIKDFGFREQIQRASISTMNNIAEGFERNTNAEFVRFLFYSKGSAGEVRSMLYIANDLGYLPEAEFQSIHQKASDIIKQIANFIKYLKTHES